MKKTSHLKKIIENARKEYSAGGRIKPSVCVAMALHETGFLYSKIMVKNKGYFGIKYSGTGLYYETKTTEYYSGIKHILTARFRKYKTVKEAVADYYDLFLYKRYNPVKRNYHPTEQIAKIVECGYATDPSYANSIVDIIDRYNLRLLDYYGDSVEDCFMSAGLGFDINSRKKFVSNFLKINNYRGTRTQNKLVLKKIRKGNFIKL